MSQDHILKHLSVECDSCHWLNDEMVALAPVGFTKPILRSFWCKGCGIPQVIKYKFVDDVPEITDRLIPSEVNVARPPEIGITIRPRAKSGRH
jgi:hypothetical protein